MGKRKTTALSMLFASLVRLAGCGKKQGTFGSFTARLDYVYFNFKDIVADETVGTKDSFVTSKLEYPKNAVEVALTDGSKALFIGFKTFSAGNGLIDIDTYPFYEGSDTDGTATGEIEEGIPYSSFTLFTMMCPHDEFVYSWKSGKLWEYRRWPNKASDGATVVDFTSYEWGTETKVAQYSAIA